MTFKLPSEKTAYELRLLKSICRKIKDIDIMRIRIWEAQVGVNSGG